MTSSRSRGRPRPRTKPKMRSNSCEVICSLSVMFTTSREKVEALSEVLNFIDCQCDKRKKSMNKNTTVTQHAGLGFVHLSGAVAETPVASVSVVTEGRIETRGLVGFTFIQICRDTMQKLPQAKTIFSLVIINLMKASILKNLPSTSTALMS